MDLIDLHTHLLPGIDDGARDLDETIALLQGAHASGTRKIVATPHMFTDLFGNFEAPEVREAFERLQGQLERLGEQHEFLAEIEVCLGAENYASPEFFEALDQGAVLGLNGSRYLLVEVAPTFPFSQMDAAVKKILVAGRRPVIAHVERYSGVQEDPLRLEALWNAGCVNQVNGRSFLRDEDSRVRRTAERLLEEGLVDVIASDGHRPRWRPADLKPVVASLQGLYSEKDIQSWLVTNPGRILADQPLGAEAA